MMRIHNIQREDTRKDSVMNIKNMEDFDALVMQWIEAFPEDYPTKDNLEDAAEDFVESMSEEEADHLESLGII